jgi:hypothetical protein
VTEWPEYYILIDRLPVAVDMMTWARWFEKTTNRQIAVESFENCTVSTVFLGLDHSFGNGEPVLFETMIFGGSMDGEQWRYRTYAEAERGHVEAVTAARIAAAKIKSIKDNAARPVSELRGQHRAPGLNRSGQGCITHQDGEPK